MLSKPYPTQVIMGGSTFEPLPFYLCTYSAYINEEKSKIMKEILFFVGKMHKRKQFSKGHLQIVLL